MWIEHKSVGLNQSTWLGISTHFLNKYWLKKFLTLFRAKTRPVNPKTLNFSFEDDGVHDGLNIHDVVTGIGMYFRQIWLLIKYVHIYIKNLTILIKGNVKRRHIVCFTNKQVRLSKNIDRPKKNFRPIAWISGNPRWLAT